MIAGHTIELPRIYSSRAKAYLARQDFDRALSDTNQMILASADDRAWRARAYVLRARIQNAKGDDGAAIASACEAIETAIGEEARIAAGKLRGFLGGPTAEKRDGNVARTSGGIVEPPDGVLERRRVDGQAGRSYAEEILKSMQEGSLRISHNFGPKP